MDGITWPENPLRTPICKYVQGKGAGKGAGKARPEGHGGRGVGSHAAKN